MIGIYRDGSTVFLAKLKKKNHTVQTVFSATEPTVKRLYLTNGEDIVSGLDPQDTLIKQLTLNVPKKSALHKILAYEAESLHFLKPDQTVTIPIIQETLDPKNPVVSFHTTAKNSLKKHIDSWEKEEVFPSYVSSTAQALVRYAHWDRNIEGSFCILHLGLRKSSCVYVENGFLKQARSIAFGVSSLIDASRSAGSAPLSEVNFFEDQDIFQPICEVGEKIKEEVLQAFSSFSLKKPVPLLISGHAELIPNFIRYLMEYFTEHVSELLDDSPNEIANSKQKKYAISIGLALDALLSDRKSLQFRKGEFLGKKQIKKRFWQMSIYTIFCVLASSFVFYGVQTSLEKQKSFFEEKLLLSLLQDYEKSHRRAPQLQGDLSNHLDGWNSALHEELKTSFSQKKTPQMRKILNWVFEELLRELASSSSLKTFSFEEEPLGFAKVSLAFSALNEETAEELENRIFSNKKTIQLEKGITWEKKEQTYFAEFYLRKGAFL